MTITDKLKRTAQSAAHRAYDSVRRTVAPTDFERMAKIKSETARRTRENERQRQYNKELLKRNAARNESERLRQQRDKLTGRTEAGRRTRETIERIGTNSMELFGGMYGPAGQQPPSGNIGILRMYDTPPQQSHRRRQEPSGNIGFLRMYDPPQPQRQPRRRKKTSSRKRSRR
ncbi:MAG: hypothetical protein O0X93_03885 [Methanocorpusculum sp.]|nr:hypothetical protein [Methanocorpusculum sp.]MDE2522290.1 hypothetical protein [Methanocorpusculum sp.]MDE2523659.1 hypothetical protein [Methanocorpusculum sp.]